MFPYSAVGTEDSGAVKLDYITTITSETKSSRERQLCSVQLFSLRTDREGVVKMFITVGINITLINIGNENTVS